MVRLEVFIAVLFAVVSLNALAVEGCHAGHTQGGTNDYSDDEGVIDLDGGEDEDEGGILDRKKRQVEQFGDDFSVLRRYFRDCMCDKVQETWDWRSIVDFTILKSVWYLYSGSVACSEKSGQDNSVCWNSCINAYLKNSSSLIGPAKECIRQYELDFSAGKARYTKIFDKPTDPPATRSSGKYLECVQTQYNEADPLSVFENTGVLLFPAEEQLDIYSVATFVRNHVRCVICSSLSLPSGLRKPGFWESLENNGQEVRDGSIVYSKTWPFLFEASVRQDARLRYAINFCNKEYEGTFRKDPPPNLGWTQWYIWGSCDSACGSSGFQTRIRVCLDETGRNCTGKKSEKRVCHNIKCAHWSNWGKYTECLSTCDVSEQYSFRYCKNGDIGDDGCLGPRMRTRSCAVASCPVPWTTWSACSVTCGSGIQERTGGESLIRVRTQKKSCTLAPCPEQWTLWSPWGPCSKTCGGGTRERVRKCLSKRCYALSKQSISCVKPACIEGWGEWASWSGCNYKRRTRICHGSSNCKGESERYQRCITKGCPTVSQWSDWSTWSKCDSTCGHGQRKRYRTCLGHSPAMSSPCVGNSSESDPCSRAPCVYPEKRSCADKYVWSDFCSRMLMHCNANVGKVWCRKSCGHC